MDRRRFISSSTKLLAASSILPLLGKSATSFADPSAHFYGTIESIRQESLTKIAFGSCNRQYASQRHWEIIAADRPDLWVWLGDNIYADHLSIEERAKEYLRLKTNPYYQEFRMKTPLMGTWDDHDFASDNKGGEFPEKDASQDLFMDFLDLPLDHSLRSQRGVYHSEVFGPVGRQVEVFTLDLRYFRANPREKSGLLGDVQWDWLISSLQASTADLIIIASSLHVTSSFTGLGLEGWNQFPEDRNRFYEVLAALDVPVLLLSGDRHMAEFTKAQLPNGKTVYEFMSSGMTHSANLPLPDRNRIGRVVGARNYGLITIDWSMQRPNVLLEIKSTERQETFARFQPNFANERHGILSSNW
ncbi:MAG: alkaline phosphatase D family protein [Oligoflexus sp.]